MKYLLILLSVLSSSVYAQEPIRIEVREIPVFQPQTATEIFATLQPTGLVYEPLTGLATLVYEPLTGDFSTFDFSADTQPKHTPKVYNLDMPDYVPLMDQAIYKGVKYPVYQSKGGRKFIFIRDAKSRKVWRKYITTD